MHRFSGENGAVTAREVGSPFQRIPCSINRLAFGVSFSVYGSHATLREGWAERVREWVDLETSDPPRSIRRGDQRSA